MISPQTRAEHHSLQMPLPCPSGHQIKSGLGCCAWVPAKEGETGRRGRCGLGCCAWALTSLIFFFPSNQQDFFFFPLSRVPWGGVLGVCRRLMCQGATLMLQKRECDRRLLMSHSLLYRRSALMLVRAAHRAAVNLTIRDKPYGFGLGTARVAVSGGVEGRRVRLIGWRRESWSSLATRLAGDRWKMQFSWAIDKGALGMWSCIWYEGLRLHRDGTF